MAPVTVVGYADVAHGALGGVVAFDGYGEWEYAVGTRYDTAISARLFLIMVVGFYPCA